MTTFVAGFEGQTLGTAITVANSDDFGDSPIAAAPVGTVTYGTTNVHGGAGSLTMGPTSAGQANIRYDPDGADFTSFAVRFYLTITGLPGADCNFPFRVNNSASSQQSFSLLFRTSTGILRIANSAGTVIVSTTAGLATGTLYRVEVQGSALNGSTTSLALQVFAGDSLTPVTGMTISATNVVTTNARLVYFGLTSNQTMTAWQIDDIRLVTGSATALGPSAPNGAVFGAVVADGTVSGSVSSGVVGDVSGPVTAGGTVSGQAGAVGSVSGPVTASGTVTGLAGAVGSVTGPTTASGTVAGAVGKLGTVTGSTTVGGTVAGVAGKLGAVSGAITATGVVTGTVARFGAVTGAITAGGTVAGSVSGGSGVTGDVTGSTTASGTVAGAVGAIGAITGPTTASGTVSGSLGKVATVATPTVVSGTVSGLVAKLAQVSGVITAGGTLAGAVGRSGVVQGAITAGGSVVGIVTTGTEVTTCFVVAGDGAGPFVGQGARGQEPYAGVGSSSGPFVTGVR